MSDITTYTSTPATDEPLPYRGFVIKRVPILATIKFVAMNPDGSESGISTLSERGTIEAIDSHYRRLDLERYLDGKPDASVSIPMTTTTKRTAAKKLGRRDIKDLLV